MKNHTTVTLKDIAEITAGQSAPQGDECFSDNGTPFVRAGSLDALLNGKTEDDLEHIEESVAKDHRLRLFPKDTVLFAKSGMSAKLGRIYRLRKPAYVVSHLAAILPKASLESRYLQRWLEHSPPSRLIPNDSYPSIGLSAISKLEVSLPALPEQRRIADILDKADGIRRKRQEEMNLANAIRRSVFLESFGDPDVNEKRLPLVKFSSVWIDGLRNGISPSSRGKHQGKVLVLSAITGSAFNHDAVKEGTFDKPFDGGQLVKADEFLICRGNGNLNLVGAGRFPIISLNDTVFPDTMIAARLNREVIEPAYLEEIWSSRSVRAQLERSARTTNGTYKVNQQVLAEITFPLTPLTAQRKYASIVTAIKELIHLYETSPTDDLFNSLVQRAFRGEL